MNLEESKPEPKNYKYQLLLGVIGSMILIGFCALSIGIISLLGWGIGQNLAIRHSILLFYSPLIGAFILMVGSIICILISAKNHRLTNWKTYIPLIMLIVYSLAIFAISHLIVYGYAIPIKVLNSDNRLWSQAMINRGRGGWPTGITCVLSEHVAVLVSEWSFITPNGRMPVLTWTDNSLPNPYLPGNPVSCSQLEPNWYICYLTKPYQLVLDQYGNCDQR
jgi:hypothetical protein